MKSMFKKIKKHKLYFIIICSLIVLSGCNKNINNDQIVKSMQTFKKNSGSNYIFVSNNLQDEK